MVDPSQGWNDSGNGEQNSRFFKNADTQKVKKTKNQKKQEAVAKQKPRKTPDVTESLEDKKKY